MYGAAVALGLNKLRNLEHVSERLFSTIVP